MHTPLLAITSLSALLCACVNGELRRVAARGLECPGDDVVFLSHHESDTAEVHQVSGCGRTGEVWCSAPDETCTFAAASDR